MNLLASADLMTVGVIGLSIVVGLIMLGVPVALSIFAVGFGGQFLLFDLTRAGDQLYQVFHSETTNILLAAIPLFIFMGQLVAASTIAKDLYDALYKWIGRLPGGLAITGITAGAGFGAVTGVSAAAVATMSSIALPQMERYGYSMRLASGAIASSSALAILIPPSLLMIIYGIATETSIGQLFLAGLFPGLLLTLTYSAYVLIVATRNPSLAPRGEYFSWSERFRSLAALLPVLIIFSIIIFGIYGGVFTPSEAAGVGAFIMLAYLALSRRLSIAVLSKAAKESLRLSVMIYFIFIAVKLLTSFLALTGVIESIVGAITDLGLGAFWTMMGIVLLYLILGMLLDGIGMLILTLPVVFPVVVQLGYDPVLVGIVVTLLVEIGLLTPPVGLNCYILRQVHPSLALATVFRGVVPFVIMTLIWVVLFIIWPEIILWVL